jgi:LuxR family maltose regulon positive regulatory protein
VEKGARARLRATAAVLGGAATAVPLTEEAQGGPPVVVVESLLLRACQLVEAGRVPQAVDDVERALELARPEALRLPFVVAPPQIRRLLRTHPKLQGPGAWLSTLAAPSGHTTAPAGGPRATEAVPLTQELSERETEVLQHLAEMLSTAEIASVMFISVNTVRTHIRSILRKLGVTRRNQAVRRARELGRL